MGQTSYTHLRKNLRDLFTGPVWPCGIRLARFEARRHAEPAHRFLTAAYRDGGGQIEPFATWWPSVRNDPDYDRSLLFLALDDEGDIAGLAHCWTSSFLKDLAVSLRWRRQGLGEALVRHAFSVFCGRGATHFDLKVEHGNPSGAERLYRRLGMTALQQTGEP